MVDHSVRDPMPFVTTLEKFSTSNGDEVLEHLLGTYWAVLIPLMESVTLDSALLTRLNRFPYLFDVFVEFSDLLVIKMRPCTNLINHRASIRYADIMTQELAFQKVFYDDERFEYFIKKLGELAVLFKQIENYIDLKYSDLSIMTTYVQTGINIMRSMPLVSYW